MHIAHHILLLYFFLQTQHHYFEDIKTREDGGTPAFMQTIRAALAVRLKEQIGVERHRAVELLNIAFARLSTVPGLNILAYDNKERLGVISFFH